MRDYTVSQVLSDFPNLFLRMAEALENIAYELSVLNREKHQADKEEHTMIDFDEEIIVYVLYGGHDYTDVVEVWTVTTDLKIVLEKIENCLQDGYKDSDLWVEGWDNFCGEMIYTYTLTELVEFVQNKKNRATYE